MPSLVETRCPRVGGVPKVKAFLRRMWGGGGREEGFVRRGEGCDQNARRIKANK